jgi:hypothetical protein
VDILLGFARLIAQEIHLLLALEFSDLFLLAERILLTLNPLNLYLSLHSFELLIVSQLIQAPLQFVGLLLGLGIAAF